MASGDRPAAVRAAAGQLGIDDAHAGATPRDKQEIVRDAEGEGGAGRLRRRWHQRRPGARGGGGGDRHGHRLRRRGAQRRPRPPPRRSHGHRAGAAPEPGRPPQYPPEPVLGADLQWPRDPRRRGSPLPLDRPPARPHVRRRGHVPEFPVRRDQRPPAAPAGPLTGPFVCNLAPSGPTFTSKAS